MRQQPGSGTPTTIGQGKSDEITCPVADQPTTSGKSAAKHHKRIPEITKLITRIKGEFPGASVEAAAAGLNWLRNGNRDNRWRPSSRSLPDHLRPPLCQICEVPIDRALAEGCRLSHKLPDLDAAKRRMTLLEREHTEESNRLRYAFTERDGLIKDLQPAQRDHDFVTKSLRDAERMHDARTDAWYESRRLIDDVDRLDALLVGQEQLQSRIAELERTIQENRDHTGSFRDVFRDQMRRRSTACRTSSTRSSANCSVRMQLAACPCPSTGTASDCRWSWEASGPPLPSTPSR